MSCTCHDTSSDHPNPKRERGIGRFHLARTSGYSVTSVGHDELFVALGAHTLRRMQNGISPYILAQ